MRVSVDDVGHEDVLVFFNGKLAGCVREADDEEGWIEIARLEDGSHLFLDPATVPRPPDDLPQGRPFAKGFDGNLIYDRLSGDVSFRRMEV